MRFHTSDANANVDTDARALETSVNITWGRRKKKENFLFLQVRTVFACVAVVNAFALVGVCAWDCVSMLSGTKFRKQKSDVHPCTVSIHLCLQYHSEISILNRKMFLTLHALTCLPPLSPVRFVGGHLGSLQRMKNDLNGWEILKSVGVNFSEQN